MYEIVVVGTGQLGSRHLQGLVPLLGEGRLHLLDPSAQAVATAIARAAEIKPSALAQLECHGSTSSLPRSVDLAIIATTSDRRFAAVSALLERIKVRYLILEKVLFQKFREYQLASELFSQHDAAAWVNCPRRLYEIYRTIRAWFEDDEIISIDVFGGNWGLGCNGVHFLDLFLYLTGDYPEEFDTSGLDPECIPARRNGFFEYTGTLRVIYARRQMALTARRNSTMKHLITIRGERQTLFIDEDGGVLLRCPERGESELVKFSVPLQSQITGGLAREVLNDGKCDLTPYSQSAKLHVPFLKALASHASNDTRGACLVT